MNRPGAVASGRFIVLWGSAFVRPPQKEAAPTPGGRRAARDRNPSSRIPDWRHPYWLRSTAAYKCGPTAGNRLAGLPATSPARSRTSTASRSFGRHGGRRRTSGHPPSTRPTTRECVISAGKEPIRLPIRHEHPTARRPGGAWPNGAEPPRHYGCPGRFCVPHAQALGRGTVRIVPEKRIAETYEYADLYVARVQTKAPTQPESWVWLLVTADNRPLTPGPAVGRISVER